MRKYSYNTSPKQIYKRIGSIYRVIDQSTPMRAVGHSKAVGQSESQNTIYTTMSVKSIDLDVYVLFVWNPRILL